MYNSQVINHFSFNMLGGYTAGIDGIEMAGFFNIDRKDVTGVQLAGLFNSVGGNVSGLQIAGIYNSVADTVKGVQLAGISSKSGDIDGGLQLSAILNIARKVKGVQFAAFVNIADSSDYPIGLINLVKNGEKSLSLSVDEFLFTHLDFRSGGRILYGIVGIGYRPTSDPFRYAVDLGFGAHLIRGDHFNLDAEYLSQQFFDFKSGFIQPHAFKILPGYRLTKHLKFYAGPSFHLFAGSEKDHLTIRGLQLQQSLGSDHTTNIHIGLSGGLQWIF